MRLSWVLLLISVVFLSCALAVTLPVQASPFTFATVDVPGGTETLAKGINDVGQIVGVFTDPGGKDHGFLRTSDGTFTTIDVPGATATQANGINSAGQIVGNFRDAGGKDHGFLRDSGGTFTTIDVPDAAATFVYGINDAGQIVEHRKGHGFLRNADGTLTTVDVPSALNASDTLPQGINGSGQIVGVYIGAGGAHAFLRAAASAFTTIDVPGATCTVTSSGYVALVAIHSANGINNAGQIVGDFCGANDKTHGFLRSPTGTFTTVDVPGASDTFLTGINNVGQIVGLFRDASGKRHGFVTTVSLLTGDVIPTRAADSFSFTTIDVPGANYIGGSTAAPSITDVGQIVGYFKHAGGRYQQLCSK